MRIVAGKFRGRTLVAPAHEGVRPTADRVRESMFNILAHGIDGFELQGARVIDLFAGTGALGLEAMSRGAAYCLFVEDNADARALIRDNIEAFGLTGETRIFRRDATDLGPASAKDSYTLAFLDPPYGKGLGEKGLDILASGRWLVPGAICVLEERAGTAVTLPSAYDLLDTRTYGDTDVRFLRLRKTEGL
ncbi:MAG: 16S rRNA (guanine(966)-N(2))-methyltransferase RsmD [Hyphomicrobium sp.]